VKTKHRNVLVAAASAVFMLSASLAWSAPVEIGPNLVVNGGFETGDLTGWTETGDTTFNGVNCGGGCFGNYAYSAGSLDFSSISQQIVTLAGSSYNIHVFLQVEDAGGIPPISGPNEFQVLWGGMVLFDATNLPAQSYSEIVLASTAVSGLTELRFRFRDEPAFLDVDNISVRQTVPEPATLALLALGLGAIGIGPRRRRSARPKR